MCYHKQDKKENGRSEKPRELQLSRKNEGVRPQDFQLSKATRINARNAWLSMAARAPKMRLQDLHRRSQGWSAVWQPRLSPHNHAAMQRLLQIFGLRLLLLQLRGGSRRDSGHVLRSQPRAPQRCNAAVAAMHIAVVVRQQVAFGVAMGAGTA